MAGFNNEPSNQEFRRYASWGRTRGPKNLAGKPGAPVIPLTSTETLKGVTASTVGYATENQRYLHVLIEDTNVDADPGTLSIYGYAHAFQRWFKLPTAIAGTTQASLDPDAGNATPANIDPADNNRKYLSLEIVGIDRVAFVHSAAIDRVNVFAACSTF